MDDDHIDGSHGIDIRTATDEGYRTCVECGGDCVPDSSVTVEGMGFRIAFVCPEHGMQTLIDPFEDLR